MNDTVFYVVTSNHSIYDFVTKSIKSFSVNNVIFVYKCLLTQSVITNAPIIPAHADDEKMIYIMTPDGLLLCCNTDLNREKLTILGEF